MGSMWVFFSSAKHHELSDLRALTILLFLLPQGLATWWNRRRGCLTVTKPTDFPPGSWGNNLGESVDAPKPLLRRKKATKLNQNELWMEICLQRYQNHLARTSKITARNRQKHGCSRSLSIIAVCKILLPMFAAGKQAFPRSSSSRKKVESFCAFGCSLSKFNSHQPTPNHACMVCLPTFACF